MRTGVMIAACLYGLAGAALALQWLHALLITGTTAAIPGPLNGLIPLGLTYGLVTFRPWARILGLIVAGFLGFVGVTALAFCLGHVLGIHRAAGGLIVDQPALALGVITALVAFAGWQSWLLTRPSTRDLFAAGTA